MRFDRRQLLIYAVTDKAWIGKLSLKEQVEEALKGGATMVQLREKELDKGNFEEVLRTAWDIRRITEEYNVPLMIDDNLELALACRADGLHVGQNDMEASEARRLLGPDRILGVTAKTVDQARKAQAAGADYLGSGAIFGTSTKADARPMTMETLNTICDCVDIPVVAIGGICLDNIGRLSCSGSSHCFRHIRGAEYTGDHRKAGKSNGGDNTAVRAGPAGRLSVRKWKKYKNFQKNH